MEEIAITKLLLSHKLAMFCFRRRPYRSKFWRFISGRGGGERGDETATLVSFLEMVTVACQDNLFIGSLTNRMR